MTALIRKLSTGFTTVAELLRAMSRGRFWWLVPLIVFLLPVAVLFLFLQAMPIIAPFVYVVF
jgi:uncharacterized protein DUF5989